MKIGNLVKVQAEIIAHGAHKSFTVYKPVDNIFKFNELPGRFYKKHELDLGLDEKYGLCVGIYKNASIVFVGDENSVKNKLLIKILHKKEIYYFDEKDLLPLNV